MFETEHRQDQVDLVQNDSSLNFTVTRLHLTSLVTEFDSTATDPGFDLDKQLSIHPQVTAQLFLIMFLSTALATLSLSSLTNNVSSLLLQALILHSPRIILCQGLVSITMLFQFYTAYNSYQHSSELLLDSCIHVQIYPWHGSSIFAGVPQPSEKCLTSTVATIFIYHMLPATMADINQTVQF